MAIGEDEHRPAGSAFTEHWDGTRWTVVPVAAVPLPPAPPGSRYLPFPVSLTAVSCPTAVACIAVGSAAELDKSVPLIEQWDGTKWSVSSTPTVQDGNDSRLVSVSCAAASACTAVGSTTYEVYGDPHSHTYPGLIEHWDGTAWKLQPAGAGPFGKAPFIGVSCPATDACTAIASGPRVSFSQRWDGSNWSAAQSLPRPRHVSSWGLWSISCPTAAVCMSVGVGDFPRTYAGITERTP